MASGVQVDDECKVAFQDVKLGHKFRYIVYSLTEDLKKIHVIKRADLDAEYKDFLADMKGAEDLEECRYAIYDAEYQTKDGQPRNKIVFFMWNPESAKVKQRMVYSSSKDALKKALGEGIGKEVQANESSDLSWDHVMEIITRTDRN